MVIHENDIKLIDEAIQKVEKLTSGEIVVLVRKTSDPYTRINWALATTGWVVASTLFFAFSSWHLTIYSLLGWQIAGSFIGWFLGNMDPLKRSLLSKKITRYRVHREAMANFLHYGLHQTREHTGVLIYLSELEHQVEIVADSGIHKKVGESYWQSRVQEIVEGIHARRASQALLAAIEKIGAELATHFPPGPDNPDELPNIQT